MNPMKRFGDPREIAESVLFLASDGAGYINGQVLHIDGGWVPAGELTVAGFQPDDSRAFGLGSRVIPTHRPTPLNLIRRSRTRFTSSEPPPPTEKLANQIQRTNLIRSRLEGHPDTPAHTTEPDSAQPNQVHESRATIAYRETRESDSKNESDSVSARGSSRPPAHTTEFRAAIACRETRESDSESESDSVTLALPATPRLPSSRARAPDGRT